MVVLSFQDFGGVGRFGRDYFFPLFLSSFLLHLNIFSNDI